MTRILGAMMDFSLPDCRLFENSYINRKLVSPKAYALTKLSYDRETTQQNWRITHVERLLRSSALFRWQLRGKAADWPTAKLIDPWQGNPMRGGQLVQGGLTTLLSDEAYQDFGWLRDVRDYGGLAGMSLARDHIMKFKHRFHRWDEALFRPDRLGARLTHMFFSLRWFGESASDEFQQDCLDMLQFQAKILALDWQRIEDKEAQITALVGLYIAHVMLQQNEAELPALADVILDKILSSLNPDWGHKSRSPETHLRLLRKLIELRQAALLAPRQQTDSFEDRLNDIIANMANLTKLWRHQNGEFAHFQGGGASAAPLIDDVLKKTGAKGKITTQAPHTGYLRLSAGRNCLIMDAGAPQPEADFPAASTLGIEFSVGQARFIVGVGQYSADPKLAAALSQSSAHSTLTLDGLDSSDSRASRIAQLHDIEAGPAQGGMLAVASHDGYLATHGILHHRQVYLTSDGGNLRGADRLEYTGDPGEIPDFAIIRFHLHPRVSAAMLGDARILLKIHGQKAGWIFKSSGGTPQLAPSLYLENGRRTSCQQIVLQVPASQIRSLGTIEAKWAFIKSTPA